MAHFAKVKDGTVISVIVAEQDFINTYDDGIPGQWIQTSYNTRGGVHYEPNSSTPSADQSKALRKNYAGIGFTYDPVRDAFIPPKPYDSWVLNEDTCLWDSPVSYPNDGKMYRWVEETLSWIESLNGNT
jgi:hypothetical protein